MSDQDKLEPQVPKGNHGTVTTRHGETGPEGTGR